MNTFGDKFKKVIVVDLDGTLANVEHRAHLVKAETPDWDAFFRECVNDTPNKWCVELMAAMMGAGWHVMVVSARTKAVEEETTKWITDHFVGATGFALDVVMLREAGDNTPDVELKRAWLDKFGRDRILFVVDDRQRVVDMWRAEGLVCLQCYVWAERSRKKGSDL